MRGGERFGEDYPSWYYGVDKTRGSTNKESKIYFDTKVSKRSMRSKSKLKEQQ